MAVDSKIRKNLVMIVTLSATGLVAVVLLIYMLILFFDWSVYRGRTETARNEVQALVNRKPAPGDENERRIQQDIELYEVKSREMVDSFKSPIHAAVERFLEVLPPPLLKQLTDDEKEYYKKPGTGIYDDDKTQEIPLAIRKLSYDDFRKFFTDRFDAFCNSRNYTEDKERFSLTTLSLFRSECVNLFPAGSWKKALDEFVKVVKPLTYEAVNEADPLPLLLVGFGMPRRITTNMEHLARQVDEIIERKIVPMAEEGKLELGENALKFIGGSSETKGVAWKDYPMAFFHWDVFGDIVKRLCKGGASGLEEVILRTQAAEASEDGMGGGSSAGNISLENSFEQDGSYRLYHYTIVFRGSMQSLRKVLRVFDTAWMENRMYLVRGIAMYAGDNGAARVMKQITAESKREQNNSGSSERTSRRRRRRAEEEEQEQNQNKENTQIQLSEKEAREAHYRVIIKRKQKAAMESGSDSGVVLDDKANEFLKLNSSADTGSHSKEEQDEFFAEFEKSLPHHERYGYAKVLVGGEKNNECLVYLDIDYVVLEQNQ